MDKVPVGTRLIILLESKYSFDNYGVVESLKSGEDILVTATLQAMRLNDNDQQ